MTGHGLLLVKGGVCKHTLGNTKSVAVSSGHSPLTLISPKCSMASDGSNGSRKVGNTKRPSAAKKWCFTWNNYGVDGVKSAKSALAPMAPKFVFQQEEGEEKETPHLQGTVEFHKKCRPMEMGILPKQVHWEVCRAWGASIAYCSDPDKRAPGGVCVSVGLPPPIPYDWRVHEDALAPWAAKAAAQFTTWPPLGDRLIHWYWSYDGNTGKSNLLRHLIDEHLAMLCGGRMGDIAKAMETCVSEKIYPHCVVFNLCRDQGNKVSYSGVEALKDGMIFSWKNDSIGLRFPAPHVVVVANAPPPEHLTDSHVLRFNVIEVGV